MKNRDVVAMCVGCVCAVGAATAAARAERARAFSYAAGAAAPPEPSKPQAAPEPSTPASSPDRANEPVRPGWAPRAWTVDIEPMVWFAGLGGNVRLSGGSGKASPGTLGVDDPEATPAGQMFIRADDLTFGLAGFGFDASNTSTAGSGFTIGSLSVSAGDRIDTSFKYTSVEATVMWRVLSCPVPQERGDSGVLFTLDVGGGARLYDLDVSVSQVGGDASRSTGTWVEPIATLRFAMEILDDFTVGLGLSAGAQPFGGQTSFSGGVVAGFQWRFVENVGVQFGYRYLYTDLKDGDGSDRFEFDGSLAGLFGSIVFRF